MPKNISTLLATHFQRAGLDLSDPKFIDLLNLSGQIGEGAYLDADHALGRLLTFDEARSHQELRRHFRQNSLDPIDKEVERWFEDIGAEPGEVAEVLADRNTYTKLRKALEKTQQLESRKAAGRSVDENHRLQQALADALQALQQQKEEAALDRDRLQLDAENRLADFAVHTKLLSLNYANENMSRAEAAAGFRPLLERALKERGAHYRLNTETRDLELVDTTTGQPLTEGQAPLPFSDFVAGLAAEKRVLKTNDASPADRQHISYPEQVHSGRGLNRASRHALDIIEEKLKPKN